MSLGLGGRGGGLRHGPEQVQEASVTRTASSETEEETPATDLSQPSKYQTVQSLKSEELQDAHLPKLPPALMTPLRT